MKMNMKLMSLGLLAATLLMPGCAIIDIVSTLDKPLEVAGEKPKNETNKLIITGVEDKHGITGLSVAEQAKAALRKNLLVKGADIANINRDMMNRLTEEVQRIELSGGISEFRLPEAANLALQAEISSVTVNAVHVAAKRKDDGSYTKPYCTYYANAKGLMVIYNVNPVEREATIPFEGSNSNVEIGASYCRAITPMNAQSLVNGAVTNAINSKTSKIMNVLAGTGYVESARTDAKGKKVYYRISIDPNKGAQPGVRAEFLTEFDGNLVPFATGKVACTTHKQAAYVTVSKPEAIARIKKYTPVRLRYGGLEFGTLIPCNN